MGAKKLKPAVEGTVRGHVECDLSLGMPADLRKAVEELLFRALMYDRSGEGEPLTELAAAANDFAKAFYVEHDPELARP